VFVPFVCRESAYSPKVPECFRFTTDEEDLASVRLEGFEEAVVAYKKKDDPKFEENKQTYCNIISNKKL